MAASLTPPRRTIISIAFEVLSIRLKHAEVAPFDEMFDGGEWSAAVHEEAAEREIMAVLKRNLLTPDQYNQRLIRQTSERWAYENDFLVWYQEADDAGA